LPLVTRFLPCSPEKRGVWVYYRAQTEALATLGALIGDPST
jgi:hypothetical protein